MSQQKVASYFARFGGARAVYRELVREALSLLAPSRPSANQLERMVSFQTVGAIAKACGISRSTAAAELERLTNHGWFMAAGDGARLLGHREGNRYFLLADDRANTATGERQLVSMKLVADLLERGTADPPAEQQRGTGRRWQGTAEGELPR